MAKLDLGIIAGLALGVGAFALIKSNGGKPDDPENPKPKLTCKVGQHIERYNGIDTCVDNDDGNKPQCETGYHLENGICTINFSCPTGFHAENGICVPDRVDPVSCPSFYHVENGVCVPDVIPQDPPVVKTCPNGFHLDSNNDCTPDVIPPTSCPSGYHLSFGVCVPDIIGTNSDLDPSSASLIVTQILKLDGRIDVGGFSGEINTGENVKFRANHTNTSGFHIKYDWSFGDNTFDSGSNITNHTYSNIGTYTASVLITSSSGVSIEKFKIIKVNPPKPSQGDVTVQVFPQRQSIDIKLYNNHATSLTGVISYNVRGATSKSEVIRGSVTIPSQRSVTVTTGSLNEGATTISVTFRINNQQDNLVMNNYFNVNVLPASTSPTDPTTPTTTQVFKDEVKSVNDYERHPISFVTTYNLFDYVLPSKVKKIKYARIYIQAKADNFGFGGANMTVRFNDIAIGTLKWTSGNDYVLQKLDIPVTTKLKLMSNNNLKISYGHNNNWFGQPLASGFKITNANLYVEYEY